MNPMAREHVAECLDALLEFDADQVAEDAMHEAAKQVRDVPGSFRVAVVVYDDVKAGWTNRFAEEYAVRRSLPPPPGQSYIDWLACALWASETPTPAMVREEMLVTIYRAGYIHRHGHAKTVRDLLAQEGEVMAGAGCAAPTLDAEDLEYTRFVLTPLLDATDMRTAVECLFGDAGSKTLGFTPRGLSHRAGLALALHDAKVRKIVNVDTSRAG
jgi:hypothetical protein